MPTPFDNLTLDALKERLVKPSDSARAAVLFVDGDHWQGGAAWTGPAPDPNAANAAEVIARIEREFVSSNVIAEVTERHRDGTAGREPAWACTLRRALGDKEQPTADEQTLLDEADAALTAWWDERGIHAVLCEALLIALAGGRSVLRIFIPPDLIENGVVQQQDTLADALHLIWIDRPDVAQAAVPRDRRTMRQLGIYAYTEDGTERAEVTYVDGEETVLRVIEGETVVDETRLALDGHLLMFEITLKPLVTTPLMQLQKALNMALTMMQHNVVISGFVERVLANAQMPFDEVDNPADPGKKKRIYRPYDIGPGKTTALVGIPIKDDQGRITGYTSPSANWRQPVDVGTFIKTDEALYARMLQESKQLHALLSGDAVASGRSREQAMLDFAMSLAPTATAFKHATRWLLETCLMLAGHFCGRPGAFDELRADVLPRLYLGKLSAEDRNFLLAAYKEGLLSRETIIGLLDIEDVDAEIARINAEMEARQIQQTRTFASALLARQREMDSGAASTGLEQR